MGNVYKKAFSQTVLHI